MGLTRVLGSVLGAGTVAGAGLTAYAAWEARQYTLRRVEVPLLPPGARPVRVLHLSDLHLTPGKRRKQEWVSGLSTLRPDLVIDTGDNLAHAASVPVVRDSLGPLLDGLPLVARLAITTAVTVPIMTWLVMPRVTRLLRRWLYPHS